MSAIPSVSTVTARSRPVVRRTRASTTARFVDGSIAVVSGVAGLVIANGYPILPSLIVGLFIAWAAFAAWRFRFALPALLALIPVCGFATWTGWLTFEEVDLLVLASAAGGYAARAMTPPLREPGTRRHGPLLSLASLLLLAAFLASCAVALVRGVDAAGGWHFAFFDGYDGAMNGVRIFKSFAFALLVTPLVIDELRSPGGFDRIGLGLTASLAFASLAVLQERLSFTGLLEFSEDYRVTGSFWEMHVGGAALDGFLALTLPFAIREAIRHANPVRFVAAVTVIGLATYAILVTFSRGIYAAMPIALLVLALLLLRRDGRIERGAAWILLCKGLALTALVSVATFFVFRHGGYRAVAALLAPFTFAILGDGAMRRSRPPVWVAAFVLAALAAVVGAVVGETLPKGPYLVLVAACIATGAAVLWNYRKPLRFPAVLFVGAWLWLVASAVQVAGFWGGPAARHDSLVVACGLIVLIFALSRRGRPTWPGHLRLRLATIGFSVLVIASVAVFTAGAYMGERFAASHSNGEERLEHWRHGIDRLHGSDWLFGKGLGRFPATSIFEAVDGAGQGRYGLATRDGETFLRLSAPELPYLGFDEMFRLSQRVSPQPETTYTGELVVHVDKVTGIHVEMCEKHLLYNGACRTLDQGIEPAGPGWQKVAFRLNSGEIGRSHWLGSRPVFFAIALGGPTSFIDIRSMRLTGPDGTNLLVNGDFRNRTARWFTQSDKYHLPWHIKNIALDVLFDQGAIGLALFAMLASGALLRAVFGSARRHPEAPFVAAALVGYLMVGAFDSLLDVPRVAFMFYLVVVIGLAIRNPAIVSRASSSPPRPLEPAAGAEQVAAAARALRRQRAFGERHAQRADASGQ